MQGVGERRGGDEGEGEKGGVESEREVWGVRGVRGGWERVGRGGGEEEGGEEVLENKHNTLHERNRVLCESMLCWRM